LFDRSAAGADGSTPQQATIPKTGVEPPLWSLRDEFGQSAGGLGLKFSSVFQPKQSRHRGRRQRRRITWIL